MPGASRNPISAHSARGTVAWRHAALSCALGLLSGCSMSTGAMGARAFGDPDSTRVELAGEVYFHLRGTYSWVVGTGEPGPWLERASLDARYVEVKLPGSTYSAGCLCHDAVLGQASGRGGSDHPVSTNGLVDAEADYDSETQRCISGVA
jgi:hypothetical protein